MEYQDSKERIERVMDRISGDVTAFAQKLVQTRSMTCQEKEVAALVKEKMCQLATTRSRWTRPATCLDGWEMEPPR